MFYQCIINETAMIELECDEYTVVNRSYVILAAIVQPLYLPDCSSLNMAVKCNATFGLPNRNQVEWVSNSVF